MKCIVHMDTANSRNLWLGDIHNVTNSWDPRKTHTITFTDVTVHKKTSAQDRPFFNESWRYLEKYIYASGCDLLSASMSTKKGPVDTPSALDHSVGAFRATNMQIHARFEQIDVQSRTSYYQIYLREILIECTSLLAMLRKQRRLGTVATTRYIWKNLMLHM